MKQDEDSKQVQEYKLHNVQRKKLMWYSKQWYVQKICVLSGVTDFVHLVVGGCESFEKITNAMGRFVYDAYSYTPCNVIVYVQYC